MIHCYSSCCINSFKEIAHQAEKSQKAQDIVLKLNLKKKMKTPWATRKEDQYYLHIFQLNIYPLEKEANHHQAMIDCLTGPHQK